jgi:TRAP-type C4-dicarboxylate transport system permease small subunit
MAVLGAADVLAQNALNRPIPAANELLSAMLPAAFFLALAAVERSRGHIAVDVVFQMMSTRSRAVLSAVSHLLSTIFLAALLLGSWSMAIDSFERGEEAVAAIRFPIWPAKVLCAIAITFGFAASLVNLIEGWTTGRSRSPARPAGAEH